ncbi:hypothetical protein [Nocardia sp. NPDC057440]|uniref:hypothetical protein n=1 Tax=Nocardia sp. NPDC057440 TaxID=3346134 RepID=UPI00366E9445
MTNVMANESVKRVYRWVLEGPHAVVGDVRDALTAAAAKYEEVTGKSTSFDDWLRVTWGDEFLIFSFEVDDDPAPF